MMKFKFDANQEFQLQAVKAVVDCFEGQGKISPQELFGSGLFSIYTNTTSLSDRDILQNIHAVQRDKKLDITKEPVQDISVEMETGTGKTYVYLRTIFELNKNYGWTKFIILVPSVAIREGVMKTLQITEEHFNELYSNVPFRYHEYNSKNISQVKHFADSSVINIMVMTVQASAGDDRILNKERDQLQGEKPVAFIQKTRPVLILDEPQNMEGVATKKALENFKPLVRLRYSATHKNPYNLVYQLAPYDAYQLGLVKKIEVFSVTDDDSGTSVPHMTFIEATPGKTASSIKAKVELAFMDAEGHRTFKVRALKKGDDLTVITNNKAYLNYEVANIDADAPEFSLEGKVYFTNGFILTRANSVIENKIEIWRSQIAETIKLHIEKKEKYRSQGIKVLSLFFIDKVTNYVASDGIIRKLFIEELAKAKESFELGKHDLSVLHMGYFAKRKDGSFLEQASAMERNDEAFELIMRDKERLLSISEPVEFIFSHSALREGWDNPNVFNICTLNETTSTMKKRQEIGRGMRLCVNQDGDRIFDRRINLLSVIANISYADYVASLQVEFQEDGIYNAPQLPNNARDRRVVSLKPKFQEDDNFIQLWKRISKKTRYVVHVETETLITNCSLEIKNIRLRKPSINIDHIGLDITSEGINSMYLGDLEGETYASKSWALDCIGEIQEATKLTRSTVAEILLRAGNWDSFLNNPSRFISEVIKIIIRERDIAFVKYIRYELIDDAYSTKEFDNIESYESETLDVKKSIYDAIVYDSKTVEKPFALHLESDERIKLFIKLPDWFKINTPVKGYNPDWAIVTERDADVNPTQERVYFVVETKGDVNNLRATELAKIESAKKHFEVIDVNYTEIESYDQFSKIISGRD